ncbi:unnamed protein product, partial [Oppiella nova]
MLTLIIMRTTGNAAMDGSSLTSICSDDEQDNLKDFINIFIYGTNNDKCYDYKYGDKERQCFSDDWVTNTPNNSSTTDYSSTPTSQYQSTLYYGSTATTRQPHPHPDDPIELVIKNLRLSIGPFESGEN